MIAIGSFFLHLAVITLVDLELIQISDSSGLFKNPIAAIYTPFSFILIYEVYLLIYYLPKSITVYIMTAAYSFFEWVHLNFMIAQVSLEKPPRLDGIFFHQFFTILILVDVLLLLISFLKTDRFSTVIRNSGFIISTILMKVSFGTEGLLNNVLVVVAVLFGVTVLAIEKRYIKLELNS
ncbi:MAG: hypothetical protein ACK5P5_00805 [Pseudobdellovibrionaceae bacterium]